jgi:cytochrome b561
MTPTDYTLDRSASQPQRYDALTQAIHWLSLVAIATAFVIGLLLDDMPRGPGKTQLINRMPH